MANLNQQLFLESLLNQIQEQKSFAENLLEKNDSVLNTKPKDKSWSVLECIEHMNLSMLIYIDQMKNLILSKEDIGTIKIGWLGNYFSEGMRPKKDSISNKMKTAKKLSPKTDLSKTDIDVFINHLDFLYRFIEDNKDKNWNKIKLKTALGSIVKLKIGEAINFVLAHNERHIWQSNKSLWIAGSGE